MSVGILPSKPGKPLSSVLRQDSTTQAKTLKTVLQDVKKHNPQLDTSDQMRVAKTIQKLSSDPTKVVNKELRKQALGALRDSGQLRGKFENNLGAAMKEIDRQAASMNKKSISDLQKMRPSELTKEERQKLKMFKNRMRVRAAEERAEAEGTYHTEDHDTTRFGLEQAKGASVSANSPLRRQTTYAKQDEDREDKKNSSESKPPMVDMMI